MPERRHFWRKSLEPIIAARNLKKIYRMGSAKIHALDGVDIDVMPGEVCAILGTSGSGKSTLLSLLAGLEHPTAGRIFIKKKPTYKMNESELVDFRLKHIGFVFQSFNLMPTMTAVENVALPLMFRGVPRARRMEAAKKLGANPERCLVFEDIPFGIIAGKRAGMTVCAVEDEYSMKDREEKIRLADFYIKSYEELL